MVVRVRYFASLRDLTGTASEEIELGEGASVADLWAELGQRHAELRGVGYRPLVACDLQYARYETPLRGVREVAFLPPVSGG
jgi:molybdopterin converting factor subunit 1